MAKKTVKMLLDLINKARQKGAIDVFVSSLLNKVLMLISNVLIIRLMDTKDYGIFTYAYNLITMIAIVSTLGIDTAMLQFCCEDRPKDERLGLAKISFFIGIASNAVFSIFTLIGCNLIPLSIPEGKMALSYMAFLLPIMSVLNYQKYWLRIERNNRRFGLLTNIASISYLVFSVIFIILQGLNGAIIGRYLGFIVPIIAGVFLTRQYTNQVFHSERLSSELVKKLVRYGIAIALTNSVSELLYYLDVYVVGLVTTDAVSIAYYKSATVIPRVLTSIPAILMIFIHPYFAFNKERYSWVKKNVIRIQMILFPLCLVTGAVFFIFAQWIMTTLYGADYIQAVVPFRILIISAIFSSVFRLVAGNVLAMLGRVKENFVMSTVECGLNVILDYILVKNFGGVGAAVATLIITIISSIMCNGYLYWFLAHNLKKDHPIE